MLQRNVKTRMWDDGNVWRMKFNTIDMFMFIQVHTNAGDRTEVRPKEFINNEGGESKNQSEGVYL